MSLDVREPSHNNSTDATTERCRNKGNHVSKDDMIATVERHLKAEGAGDVEGAVAVYTDDIVHDAVGFPGSPRAGKDAARDFYGFLTANFRTEGEEPLNRFFDGDTMILEQNMTGAVIGEMLGIPGNGRKVTFRMAVPVEFSAMR